MATKTIPQLPASAAALTTMKFENDNSGTSEFVTLAQVITLLNTLYAPLAQAVPTGSILMWSGTIATVPSGFQLCNGTNGTPDLRNRFVVCANADSGGIAKTTVTGSALQSGNPTHTHAGGTLNFSLPAGTDLAGGADISSAANVSGSTAANTAGTGANATIPTFFALAYIQKL